MAYLELEDIQGIIVRGYGNLPEACFMPLIITDKVKARAWLGGLAADLCDGLARPEGTAVNVAFTAPGLLRLGLDKSAMANFSEPFREGMATKRRGRILGDTGEYAADKWLWGGDKDSVHLLLLLYAADSVELDGLIARFRGHEAELQHGVSEVLLGSDPLPRGVTLPGRKEHFGFRDGISQPGIVGMKKGGPPANVIAAGEFLLGYTNEYQKYPISPSVAAASQGADVLPSVPTAQGEDGSTEPWPRDLGRNGSYLVFRQLEQDVQAFWGHIRDSIQSRDEPPLAGVELENGMTKLAAKMVGRWPSGAPITKLPDQDVFGRIQYLEGLLADAEGEAYADEERAKTLRRELESIKRLVDDDDFGYFENDTYGAQCPVGSHLRRSNPRDSLTDSQDESLRLTRHHRIIRRGRAYGATSSDWLSDDGKIALSKLLPSDGGAVEAAAESPRGVHFLAFNADIGRQFEFIQDTWINDPKFLGLYADADPIVGDHSFKGLPKEGGIFTEHSQPVRKHHPGLKRFVRMRGGAYFFMPGIRAVRYLAQSAE